MTVITAPGPVTIQELRAEASRTGSRRTLQQIVQDQISKCFQNPEARKEDLTILAKNYLLAQKFTPLHIVDVWRHWVEYFMNAIILDFPLENKRQGAWALIALSTKYQTMGVLQFTGDRRLQKCLEILRIPFNMETDVLADCAELECVLCPGVLCQIAATFDLPTNFNGHYVIWQKDDYERDHIQLICTTELMIPPLNHFIEKCEKKKKPIGPGNPNPYIKE